MSGRRSRGCRYLWCDRLESRLLFSGAPLTAIPPLNSDPGAPATLYLDFHGEPAATWGGYDVPATPAYDIDGDPTSFSPQELANIQQIWAGVAEAYSPFNVNVTTVDPGNWSDGGQHQFRDVIGGDGSWLGVVWGGVAYVGSYADPGLPDTAYVFPANLADGNPVYTADDAIHEAGHGFGLNEQSVWSGTTLTNEYNPGNGVTSPFMGLPWGAPRATWWDGTTDVAYNDIEDNVAILTKTLGLRPLTTGHTAGAATPLAIAGDSFSSSGIIESLAQQDYYSFTMSSAGSDTFAVNVASFNPMLHAALELRNASNQVIATANNAGTLGQTITANLGPGTYYLVVKSYGQYGDLGQYTLNGTITPFPPSVVGRFVFYYGSVFDIAGTAGANADDAAIATDKHALVPGQTASFANITSYSEGINGIMVDLQNAAGTLLLSDFAFADGNSADPTGWSAAPQPASMLVRAGAGTDGSTRVEFTWANGSISNQWLAVTVKADADTGLSAADVFYFGNLIGDSGEAPVNGQFAVTSASELSAYNDTHGFLSPAGITDPNDFNRDGKVDASDQLISRYQAAGGVSLLQLVAPAGPAQTASQSLMPAVAPTANADSVPTPDHKGHTRIRGHTYLHREHYPIA